MWKFLSGVCRRGTYLRQTSAKPWSPGDTLCDVGLSSMERRPPSEPTVSSFGKSNTKAAGPVVLGEADKGSSSKPSVQVAAMEVMTGRSEPSVMVNRTAPMTVKLAMKLPAVQHRQGRV